MSDYEAFAGQFIRIVLREDQRHFAGAHARLRRYEVRSRWGAIVGWVRWYGPWRCWVFLPCEGTVWSAGCLQDVTACLENINRDLGNPAEAAAPCPPGRAANG